MTITREQVLEKYWELANLKAEDTKGSIAGQLKALDSLCQELAIQPGKPGEQSQRPAGMFRPSWLNEPGYDN